MRRPVITTERPERRSHLRRSFLRASRSPRNLTIRSTRTGSPLSRGRAAVCCAQSATHSAHSRAGGNPVAATDALHTRPNGTPPPAENLGAEQFDPKRAACGAQFAIKRGERQSATLREFEIARVVQREPKTIGECERLMPCALERFAIKGNLKLDQLVQSISPLCGAYSLSPHRHRERIADLKPPMKWDDRAILNDHVKQSLRGCGALVRYEPSDGCGAVKNRLHALRAPLVAIGLPFFPVERSQIHLRREFADASSRFPRFFSIAAALEGDKFRNRPPATGDDNLFAALRAVEKFGLKLADQLAYRATTRSAAQTGRAPRGFPRSARQLASAGL